MIQPAYETDPLRRAAGMAYAVFNNGRPLSEFMKRSRSAKAEPGAAESPRGDNAPTAPAKPKEQA